MHSTRGDGRAAVRDALARHTANYELRGELHDVRPHTVYEVRFEGRRAVCKVGVHPEASAGVEGRVMRRVGEETPVPVPEVLAVGENHYVTAWADDVPADAGEIVRDGPRIRAMGRGLARLHEATSEWFDHPGQFRVVDGDLRVAAASTWSDALLCLLDDRRAFLREHGYGDVASEVVEFVAANRDLFDHDVDPVLVHGNWLPDAVGVTRPDVGRPEVARVIDFEHALVGSPAWDYLRTVTPLFAGSSPPHEGVTEAAFREAYESVRPLPAHLDRRRDALGLVNTVSYLRSLLLQRGDRDPLPAVARRARRTRKYIRERLAGMDSAG